MSERGSETYEKTAETVRRLAAKDFAAHVCEETGPGEWWCHQPGTGNYSFRVIVRPGVVVIYGDLGDGVFRVWDADPLGWLRSAVHSPSYLLEKLTAIRERESFYPGDVLASLRERAEEGCRFAKQALPEAKHLWGWGDLNGDTWVDLIDECGGDSDDYRTGWNYSCRALWLVEALWWFVGALKAQEVVNA